MASNHLLEFQPYCSAPTISTSLTLTDTHLFCSLFRLSGYCRVNHQQLAGRLGGRRIDNPMGPWDASIPKWHREPEGGPQEGQLGWSSHLLLSTARIDNTQDTADKHQKLHARL